MDKCNSSKRRLLEKRYPNLCGIINPLSQIDLQTACINNEWFRIRSSVFNCTMENCTIEDIVVRYAKENLILANVFMKTPFVTQFLKDQKENIIDYVARAGGLLGLCMGFSFVTGFEVIFYFFSGLSSGLPYQKKVKRVKSCKR